MGKGLRICYVISDIKKVYGMESYMKLLLDGSWHVVLTDGTAAQMHLPGTLDESGIGHRDAGTNQWHPDAALGNAAEKVDKDAPIATRFTRRHTYEGEARISRKVTVPDYGTDRLFVLAERARVLRLAVDGEECEVFRQGTRAIWAISPVTLPPI